MLSVYLRNADATLRNKGGTKYHAEMVERNQIAETLAGTPKKILTLKPRVGRHEEFKVSLVKIWRTLESVAEIGKKVNYLQACKLLAKKWASKLWKKIISRTSR